MRDNPEIGQNIFFRRRFLTTMGLLGCAALAAAAWYLRSSPPVAAERAPQPPPLPAAADSATLPLQAAAPIKIPTAAASPIAAAPSTPASEPEMPLAMLERRFHASSAKEDRIEVAAEIAGRRDANAVAALGRLFQAERHPAVKVALIADLNDIDRDTAPELLMRTLTAALRGQPRDVRTTALEVLAQLDDPQVEPLLKRAMATDPDHEVRDVAAALHRARFGPAR